MPAVSCISTGSPELQPQSVGTSVAVPLRQGTPVVCLYTLQILALQQHLCHSLVGRSPSGFFATHKQVLTARVAEFLIKPSARQVYLRELSTVALPAEPVAGF